MSAHMSTQHNQHQHLATGMLMAAMFGGPAGSKPPFPTGAPRRRTRKRRKGPINFDRENARRRRQAERDASNERGLPSGVTVERMGAGFPTPRGVVQDRSRRFVTVLRGETVERWPRSEVWIDKAA